MKISQGHLEKLEQQFSIEFNCTMQDFEKEENIITPMVYHPKRRCYTDYNPMFRMISFYDKLLVTAELPFYEWARERYRDCFSGWVFSMKEVRALNEKLAEEKQYVSDLHHYFLPLEDFPHSEAGEMPKAFAKSGMNSVSFVWVEQEDIGIFRGSGMYQDAFAFNPRHPDVIGVLAVDRKCPPVTSQEKQFGGKILGAAGASADGEDLWQIGITVNKENRGRGLAVRLVTMLKEEIIKLGRVPFYGTVESHNLSNSVAIKAGFFPVWSEMVTAPLPNEIR